MCLHYLVKLNIHVFVKLLLLEKRNSTNYTYLGKLLLGFTKINTSDHKCAKHYLNMLAELNNMVFSTAPHLSGLN